MLERDALEPGGAETHGRTPTSRRPNRPHRDLLAAARLLSRVAATVQAYCHEQGVTLRQYRVLVFLSEQPMRSGEVAALLGVTRPAASALIRGLEARDLLERGESSDGARAVRIRPSGRGRELVETIDDMLTSYVTSLLAMAPQGTLADVVEAVADVVDREALAVRDRLRSLRSTGPRNEL